MQRDVKILVDLVLLLGCGAFSAEFQIQDLDC